jgi:hypothetical protein
MPKVGMTKNKLVSAGLLTLVVSGYICGFAMVFPESCFWMPTGWCIIFLIWGQASAKARAMYPPPLFPKKDPVKALIRPQADIEDIVLDEAPEATPDRRPEIDDCQPRTRLLSSGSLYCEQIARISPMPKRTDGATSARVPGLAAICAASIGIGSGTANENGTRYLHTSHLEESAPPAATLCASAVGNGDAVTTSSWRIPTG